MFALVDVIPVVRYAVQMAVLDMVLSAHRRRGRGSAALWLILTVAVAVGAAIWVVRFVLVDPYAEHAAEPGAKLVSAVAPAAAVASARVDRVAHQVVRTPPVASPRAAPPARSPGDQVMSMAEFLRRLSQVRSSSAGEVETAMAALGREIALQDFANALKLMNAVSDPGARLGLCRGIFELQGVANPREAVRQALLLFSASPAGLSSGTRVAQESLLAAMRGWAYTDAPAAAAFIGELDGQYRAPVAEVVYAEWARTNPEGALRSVAALTPAVQAKVLAMVCRSWAEKDPRSAWNYAMGREAGELSGRFQILADIAATWAETDPREAILAVGRDLTEQGSYVWTLDQMVRVLMTRSPDKAAEMFAIVPGLAQRQADAFTGALSLWVSKDAAGAAQWAAAVEDAAVRGTAIKAVASYWAARDPAGATAWASALSDPLHRAYALSNVAVQQGEKNPAAALDWIERQSDPFIRARCLSGYVMGRLRRGGDRVSSFALRELIMSDELDLDAVVQTILQSRVPEAEKQALVNLVK